MKVQPKMKLMSILYFTFLFVSQTAESKSNMITNSQKTIDSLCQLNKPKTNCEPEESTPTPTPKPTTLYSDAYFKRMERDGVTKEVDWLWLSVLGKLDPMMPKEDDDFYQMQVDLLKKSKKKNQMLMMKTGKCWINMNGTYGLNETQDKIILTESSRYELSYPENCEFGTEGCSKINGKTHRVIAKNKADPPLTKDSITTDYLKPIRDAKQLIEEKCR